MINEFVPQEGPGINVITPLNDPTLLTLTGSNDDVLVAGGTQRSRVPDSLNAALNPKATFRSGSVRKPVSDRITTSTKRLNDTAKKVKDAVSGVTGGLKGRPDNTRSSNK